ncbi:COG4315 family predicted lipoprotein [Viridibacillus sp. NPDC093762]|uniref:COG4315 family predicted lipoprotein n=1 Tax=Viridibacillus sp. NPDC093762 TaxID=3390720 RepID=UPI003CFEE1F6
MKKGMFTLAILSIIFVMAACGKSTEEKTETDQPGQAQTEQTKSEQAPADSLQLLKNDKDGEYLADSQGKTLYYFKKDEIGKSNCSGDCLATWPAFTQGDFAVPEGFDKKDFGTFTRADNGKKQVTYKGFPLYYFAKDQQKGDVNGQGIKDVWFIVNSKTEF